MISLALSSVAEVYTWLLCDLKAGLYTWLLLYLKLEFARRCCVMSREVSLSLFSVGRSPCSLFSVAGVNMWVVIFSLSSLSLEFTWLLCYRKELTETNHST